VVQHDQQMIRPLAIVIIGASGDLAQRKVIPALFALYCQGFLPAEFHVYGMARSAMSHEQFRGKIAENLTCRYSPGESCARKTSEFLGRCYYSGGQYGSVDSFLDLFQLMSGIEGRGDADRLFYMAVPPTVFLEVAAALGGAGMVACGPGAEWSRVVVEKPFGRDRYSSDQLVAEMNKVFTEESTYRIDHYLGKEIVQNLMVLRFANRVFEPIWNRDYVESIRITWKEPVGLGQRGGYFDSAGIIRDVMQNHLLQILALLAMEKPAGYNAGAVRDEKVRLLKCIPAPLLEEMNLGQYSGGTGGRLGYTDEPLVPRDSLTPTYAAALLRIHNSRWDGVPVLLEAGKAMEQRINEVRMRFRAVPDHFFGTALGPVLPNELVIRIQPDEAITLRVMNKAPGLDLVLQQTELNLRYQTAFSQEIPDAYECLLLDVIQGDRSLFIRADELAAAWDIFTPILQRIEAEKVRPELYGFGSTGPASLDGFLRRLGVGEREGGV
jgi:glucose-6-phosphate 1-dehydrogenase